MGSLMSRTSLELMQKGSVIEVQPWINHKQLQIIKRNMIQSDSNTLTGLRSWFQKMSKKNRTQPLKDTQHINKDVHKDDISEFNDYEEELTYSDLEYDWTSETETRKGDATFTVSMPNLTAPIKHKPTKKSLFYFIKKQGGQYHIETGSCPFTQQWYANVLDVVPVSEDQTLKKSISMPTLQVLDHTLSGNFSNDPSYPDTYSSEESLYTAISNVNLHVSANAKHQPNETNVFFVVRERHGCLVIAAVECSNVHRWFARKFHRLPDAHASTDTLHEVPSIRDEMWDN